MNPNHLDHLIYLNRRAGCTSSIPDGRPSAVNGHLRLADHTSATVPDPGSSRRTAKQGIRAGVFHIKGGRPSLAIWGFQNRLWEVGTFPSFGPSRRGCSATRRHARADETPLDSTVGRKGWVIGAAGKVSRHGQNARKQQNKEGCNQPGCGQNSAILQPGISLQSLGVLGSAWPCSFLQHQARTLLVFAAP